MESLPIKARRKQNRAKRGAVTLEAAISGSVFIVFIFSILMILLGVEAEVVWRSSLHKTGTELALMLAESPEAVNKAMESEGGGGEFAKGVVMSQVSGPLILSRANYWFDQATTARPWLRPLISKPFVYVTKISGKNFMRVSSGHRVPTFLGAVDRTYETVIPLWSESIDTGGGRADDDKDGEDDDDNIWSKGNFVRGDYFRETEGGSLPTGYPVIASFNGGKATSIKSIDLTAPNYKRLDELGLKLEGHVKELARFQGTEKPWGRQKIHITSDQITSRELIVVIPENSPPAQLRQLEAWVERARKQNVSLVIKKRGESKRYQKKNEGEAKP